MAIALRERQQRVTLPKIGRQIESIYRGVRRFAFAEKKEEKKEGQTAADRGTYPAGQGRVDLSKTPQAETARRISKKEPEKKEK